MAQDSNSTSVSQVGNFESRADAVKLAADETTKFISDIGWERVYNNIHNWSYQTMKAPSATASGNRARTEGAGVTHAATDMELATTSSNAVQEIIEPFQASFAQDMVKKPQFGNGKLSEFDRQGDIAYKTLLRNIDAAAVSDNAQQNASSSQVGISAGAQTIIPSERRINVAASGAGQKKYLPDLVKTTFDEAIRLAYKSGGKITDSYSGLFQKDRIAQWVTAPQRNISEQGTTLTDSIDVYKNTAKMVIGINFDYQMDFLFADDVILIQKDLWNMGWLVPPATYKEGLDATATKGFASANFTVVCYAPPQNALIQNLRKDSN